MQLCRNGRCVREKLARPVHGFPRGHVAQRLHAEGHSLRRIAAQMFKNVRSLRPQQAVDVLAFRKEDDLAGQPPRQQHLACPQGRLASGLVAVEQEFHMRREPRNPLDLLRGERRPEHAHRARVPELMQRHHVHVTFRQHGGLPRGDGAPGLLEAVQVLALLVQQGIAAVDVLGLVLVGDDAPAEGDHKVLCIRH